MAVAKKSFVGLLQRRVYFGIFVDTEVKPIEIGVYFFEITLIVEVTAMDRKSVLSLLMAGVMFSAYAENERKSLFNEGWKFYLTDSVTVDRSAGDIPDSLWQDVRLPHDWSILLPFDRNAPSGNDGGYLPGGTAWYHTDLNLKQVPTDRKLKLYFEGIYERSEIYVNDKLAGGHPYGYTSFFVDITPFLKKGDNRIAVKVDNSGQKNSRWYTGSGIYRNVWLLDIPEVHIADWGVSINTPDITTADITVTAENSSGKPRNVQIIAEIDGISKTVAKKLNPGESGDASLSLSVPDARPWSPETPNLYTAKISVMENGKLIDSIEQPFGFRTISYSAADGFSLNGKKMILNGGCVHHDNGVIGAAAYDRAEYRKAELLKSAGFNAVRTSHNTPSETFLNACDEVGLLVIDEALDGWRDEKVNHDYHLLFDEWAAVDVAAMVKRDRNHPSVFCWSIGNEIIERKKPQAVKDAAMLVGVCREIDPTRPVTQALAAWDSDWEIYDPLAAEHDIVGYNYMIHKAESDHERVPGRVMMQTESFPGNVWGSYRAVKDHPYVIGDFVWTAIDYTGESGIGRWYYDGDLAGEHYHQPLYPWHAAYCGDMDMIGHRKPISHYRSMLWNEDGEKLFIAVKEPDGYYGKIRTTSWSTWPTFESWNWAGHEGKPIEVEVYSRYPKVRLYLDGKLLGEKESDKMKATFTVDYAPGKLTAEGVDGGKVMEIVSLETAGEVAGVRLMPDRNKISADGQDLSFIMIELVDKEGHVVPMADNQLTVTVNGPVTLAGFGNADIKDIDPYYDNTHRAWKGRAIAVVRNDGKSGKAEVTVSAKTADGKDIAGTAVLDNVR